MLRNYLAAALRNLARNRLHSVITTLSLAIGFAAMIIAMLVWRYDHGFDRFWPDAMRLHKVMVEVTAPQGVRTEEAVPANLAPAIKSSVRGVEAVGRIDFEMASLVIGPTSYRQASLFWADPELFGILRRRAVAGDLAASLADPSTAILSEDTAKEYFGDNPAVGQSITIETHSRKAPQTFTVRVGAVVADLPSQTHLQDDAIYLSTRSTFAKLADPAEMALFYVKVRPGVTKEALSSAIRNISGPALSPKGKETRRLTTVPVTEVFLGAEDMTFGARGTPTTQQASPTNALIFLGLGGLILFVAALNFITLMTARGTGRAVEVGVRKSAGARRRDLVVQFVGEAVIYAGLAFTVGLAVTELFLPLIRKFGIPDLRLNYATDFGFLAGLGVAALGVGLLAGLYPALALSSFRPAAVLKGGRVKSPGSALLRQILMTAQFTPALLLAFGALTLYAQMERSADHALTMADPNALAIEEECTPFLRDRIAALPGVKTAICMERLGTSNSPQTGSWHIGQTMGGKVLKPSGDEVPVYPTLTDANGLRFFDLKVLAGRLWSGPSEAGVIINETAMRALGFKSPIVAVGTAVDWKLDEKPRRSTIIGVVADRGGFSGFEEPLFYQDPDAKRMLSIGVKLHAGPREPVLKAIDAVWEETGALRPMEREFYDDWVDESRQDTLEVMALLAPIAAAALLISALGLFGLAAFLADQRTKEIGVRKALGAGRRELLGMLVFQFTRPVVIAAAIAVPIVFVLLNVLMSRAPAEMRISPSPGVYAAVLGGAVVLALAATFSHAWRVTGARPVTALRYE